MGAKPNNPRANCNSYHLRDYDKIIIIIIKIITKINLIMITE
jgi:hypothetical protein